MNKKNFIYKIIFSIIASILIIGAFYYFIFLKPLKSNGEIFSKTDKALVQKEEISDELKEKFGISLENIPNNKKVYWIDGREIEEFENNHILGAKNIRTLDIESFNNILNVFDLHINDVGNSFFIIYCHDGTRSAEVVSKTNMSNVRFLLEGVKSFKENNLISVYENKDKPVFKKHIQNRDFTVSPDKSLELLKKDSLFIDGRLYSNQRFDFAYNFRIGQLSSKDYKERLRYILKFKDKDIVYIADIYPDLFYAKILAQRLESDYGFSIDDFHVLLGETNEFLSNLESRK